MQISTTVEYMKKLSHSGHKHYVFHYHVTIKNIGSGEVRLLRRHWVITNGDGEQQKINGEGVVGEQPTLPAEAVFTYSSSAVLSTPFGTMEGYYEFVAADGHEFKADIPLFRLALPNILQ